MEEIREMIREVSGDPKGNAISWKDFALAMAP